MHINRLKVGVLLENYKKEEGGAHSYYNTLVEGIADYKFDANLEFVFIAVGKTIDPSAPEKSLLFNIDKIMKRKHTFFSILNMISKLRGINYFPLAIKIQKSYLLRFNEEIKNKLVENEIDLIYSLTPYYNDLNYPTVITHWDIGHKSTFAFPEVMYNDEYEFRELFYRRYLQKAFAIMCESEAGKKELCSYKNINPNKVFVVPMFAGNMVNLKVEEAEEKTILDKFKIKKTEFFLYPSQFWAHKNHYNLILAFEEFGRKHQDVKLLLPGSNKGNLPYIKELVKGLGIEQKVIFGGFVTNEELNVFYKNAISLVMPTFMGPTNMPLLEAQALGCPVICTDFPGHRESLGENAIYINPSKKEDILQALEDVYAGKDFESNKFKNSLENSLIQINKIFNRLISIRKTFPVNFKVINILFSLWAFS
ncbi:glycosyltransferase family 4 protein [Pedobacter jamesrossensis]|uniref:Glycosyltransferase family 4 protein n=1 Tax=Pedobacter jamesrossensis TaxID=1908238 RepID=A0ABV8NNI7_9SPHI